MSLDDRDWYRAEMAARRRRVRAPRWMDGRALVTLAATLAVVIAATPLLMTPRATYGDSWQALADQVAANVHCTRIAGFVIIVRPQPCQ
jgi:hypothetical protein